MGEEIEVVCPWCFESLPLWIDRDTSGELVQDCDVCCRPWRVFVAWEEAESEHAHGSSQADTGRCHVDVQRA